MELDELRRIAAREELSLNFIAKDEMISRLLLKLQGFDNIILKGGTAINRVYLKNKRFSEDIDLDLIFPGGVRQAIPTTKGMVNMLQGFEVEMPRIMKETIRYDLFFKNPLNHRDRIMLEFYVVKKTTGYTKRVVNFGFAPGDAALLNVYEIEVLIAQKVACIMQRVEGKDFFDLYYLMDVKHKRLRNLPKGELLNRISLEEQQIKTVANVVNHYLPRNSRPEWVSFLEELKEKIRKY